MSFFLSSPASTSASTSIASSPNLETGLTTLEDIELAKSAAGEQQTAANASASVLSPVAEDDADAEASTRYTPLSRAQSEVHTTFTYPGLELFAFSDAGAGAGVPAGSGAGSAVSSSSAFSSAAGSSSESGSSGSGSEGDGDSGSTVRTRATAGPGRSVLESAGGVSTAVSPSVVSTLPRIRLPDEDVLRSLLFEPPLSPEERSHRSHRRRRSSGSDRRKVIKYHERGISRDFLLIVALCTGFACTVIVVGRPAMMSLLGRAHADGFDFE